ncbi:MAG TPA: hypothetical protein VFS05_10930 [Gemmatimonadaceae bacterium]|nr:hypothetical protein [Gemmatimonadaceae bacterium]
MTTLRLACVLLLSLAACGHAPERRAADTGTQRQRDSAIGASSLPGAAGVRGAIDASDAAASRDARLDSIAAEP